MVGLDLPFALRGRAHPSWSLGSFQTREKAYPRPKLFERVEVTPRRAMPRLSLSFSTTAERCRHQLGCMCTSRPAVFTARIVTSPGWYACHPRRRASHLVASLTGVCARAVSCLVLYRRCRYSSWNACLFFPPTWIRLKNESSLFSMTVRELTTQFRLLLTGTPLQVSVCLPHPALL